MRLYAEHVRLNQGGYTSPGRYFGQGPKLYRVSDETGEVDVYVRAPNAVQARALVQQKLNERSARPSSRNQETGELYPFRQHHMRALGAVGAAHDEGQARACAGKLRLVHLPASRNWCFKLGNDVVRLTARQEFLFFETRAEAVALLPPLGLVIDRYGCVFQDNALRYPTPDAS